MRMKEQTMTLNALSAMQSSEKWIQKQGQFLRRENKCGSV